MVRYPLFINIRLTLKLIFFAIFLGFLSPIYSAEPVVLTELNGQQILFSSLKGKWIFINYWASWCDACLDEIPALNRFYQRKKSDIVLFGVNYDNLPANEQIELIKQYDIRYPSLQQDPASLLQLGDIRAIPTTFVFNPKGELANVLYGGQTFSSLSRVLQR